ncbi:transient receptor potential cation channel subfamily M member-like 2 [Babylonia areolata]|uniref:transient receptor potential cation channel subfamily M member-like 2 n=1 Tax=Babylonia areolata TaxID=304850 RepID=UPI003FD384B0
MASLMAAVQASAQQVWNNGNTVWAEDRGAAAVTMESWGRISFHSSSPCGVERTTMFARIDASKDSKECWKEVCEAWDLPTQPSLLISVIGGLSERVDTRLGDLFKCGLFSTARQLFISTWVVTDGVSSRLTDLVGEAMEELQRTGLPQAREKAVALGVVSSQRVASATVFRDCQNKKLCHYNKDKGGPNHQDGRLPLNHHHTHFLLAEDRNPENADKFRRFDFLGDDDNQAHLSLTLVVGGDEDTVREAVTHSLMRDRPVMVLSGTGGAADVLTEHLDQHRQRQRQRQQGMRQEQEARGQHSTRGSMTLSVIGEGVTDDFKRKGTFSVKREDSGPHLDLESFLEECRSKAHLIRFFDINEFSSPDDKGQQTADKKFLFALLRCGLSCKSMVEKMSIAIDWNCIDFVKYRISSYIKDPKMAETFRQSLLKALQQDKVEFVELFLRVDENLQKFFDLDTISYLYRKSVESDSVLNLKSKIPETGDSDTSVQLDLCQDIDNEVESLLGDSRFRFLTGCFGKDEKQARDGRQAKNWKEQLKEQGFDRVTERGLFIWAVLFRHQELAFLLWKAGQDHIGACLFASRLLRSLSENAEGQHLVDMSQDLEHQADTWENRAVDLLYICNSRDTELTKKLLRRPLPAWGHPFQPADSCGSTQTQTQSMTRYQPSLKDMTYYFTMLEFATHPAFQSEVAEQWQGPLRRDFCVPQLFMILFHIFIPFFAPCLYRKGGRSSRSWVKGIVDFYSIPVTKFIANTISHLVFLALLSTFVLFELREGLSFSWLEILIHVWMAALITEDLSQIRNHHQPKKLRRLIVWFKSQWKFDMGMYISYLLALGMRLGICGKDFEWARALFGITVILAFQTSMQFFLVSKNIGPKVNMIERMLWQLPKPIALFSILMVAFGVSFAVLMYPNADPSELFTYLRVVYYPYFQLHGELFLDRFMVDGGHDADATTSASEAGGLNETQWLQNDTLAAINDTLVGVAAAALASGLNRTAAGSNGTWMNETDEAAGDWAWENFWAWDDNDNSTWDDNSSTWIDSSSDGGVPEWVRQPRSHPLVPLLLCIYLTLANILVINLIIAQMTNTFEQIQRKLKTVWNHQMLTLVLEYSLRPALVPPLSLLNSAYRVVHAICRSRCCPKKAPECTPNELRLMTELEKWAAEQYSAMYRKKAATTVTKVTTEQHKKQRRQTATRESTVDLREFAC